MFDEFEDCIFQVIQHDTVDRGVIVSAFETNIRIIGYI